MANRKLTAPRIRTIMARQFPYRWGPEYVPAQLATRGEAPSVSHCYTFHSDKLQRELHVISSAEAPFLALALYQPRLFELKEQHALSPGPYEHPLAGHPKARWMILPSTTGTVHIAERLGLLKHHPKVKERFIENGHESYRWLPGPLLRDLLLFLQDEMGPYCVSWDVKAQKGKHGLPGPGTWDKTSSPRRISDAKAKDDLYVEYMRELNVPIVRVAREDLDSILAENLVRLLEEHHQPVDLHPHLHVDILESFAAALQSGRPPNEVIDDYVQKGVAPQQARLVLVQAIWSRRIRIDLYRRWRIDRPLPPEERDPIDDYAHWFRRQA